MTPTSLATLADFAGGLNYKCTNFQFTVFNFQIVINTIIFKYKTPLAPLIRGVSSPILQTKVDKILRQNCRLRRRSVITLLNNGRESCSLLTC